MSPTAPSRRTNPAEEAATKAMRSEVRALLKLKRTPFEDKLMKLFTRDELVSLYRRSVGLQKDVPNDAVARHFIPYLLGYAIPDDVQPRARPRDAAPEPSTHRYRPRAFPPHSSPNPSRSWPRPKSRRRSRFVSLPRAVYSPLLEHL